MGLGGTMNTVLFTVHGSHLYGLDHEDSDYDTYRVVLDGPKGKSRQWIHLNHDATEVHIDRFVEQCFQGVPQALEALYSRSGAVNANYAPFLRGIRVNKYQACDTYRRTALAIGLSGDGFKARRHGLRLALNLQEFMEFGRFDPTLNPTAARWLGYVTRLEGQVYEYVLRDILDRAVHIS